GVADWDFGKGVADLAIQEKEFEPEGRELELTELQTTVADAAFDATGAYDLANRIVSRGRVTLNNFEAPKVLALLPEKMRRAVPWELQGRMSARMLLKESDPFHMIAHVELLEPERLQAFAPNRPAASTRTPLAVVSNFDLSGDIYFPLQPAGTPDVSSGRFTADQILLATPGRPLEAGLALGKIKSDFTYTPDGKAQLNDFYADLPGNGRLSVDGEYIAATGALSHSTLNLNGVDASLVNPWMPAGWTLTGQIDAGVQLALSQRNAEGTLSLGFGAQSALRSPDGVLTLTGSPAPTAAAHVAFDRVTGIVKWDTGELTNFGALQLDAGMVKAARQWFNPAAGSALDKALDAAAGGAMLSFDKFGITGSRGADRSFAGNLVLNGLDFSVATDKTPRLQNLTFKAGLSLPATPDLPAIKLTDGQLLAEKLTIGQEVLTEITTAMTIDQGKLLVNRLAFAGAEGSVEGDAALTLPAQLDTLHLNFTNLSQQILTASLYPDKFTAEGPVSGKLTLSHTSAGIGGSADLVLDKPGRLKIARETAKEVFAPQALAAAKSQLSMLPDNFEDIVISQLADFPYTSGRVALEIFPDRIGITPNYVRPPLKAGDPGYSVPVTLEGQHVNIALEFQLKGLTLMVHQLFTEVIRNTAVMKSFTNPPKQNP
ncbi:MAG TPA: hypothetical protein VHM90_10575, partial [Phycisphaerae bacterium]|nr:hypothetical protein [Phycisphaerae bacterium]